LTPLQRFLKWGVANPSTRPISPFSDLTVADWGKNMIKEGTLDDLRAAMLVDPANARLAAHFGLALANFAIAEKTDPDDARRARAEADTQTQRAVELAPADDEVKTLRADVVKRLQLGSELPVLPAPPASHPPVLDDAAALGQGGRAQQDDPPAPRLPSDPKREGGMITNLRSPPFGSGCLATRKRKPSPANPVSNALQKGRASLCPDLLTSPTIARRR
jgi:hypothetical protein